MQFFRTTSKVLAVIAAGLALFDVCYFWITKSDFYIRPIPELWKDVHKASFDKARPYLENFIPQWDMVASLPAPVVLLGISVVLYILFRIIFMIRGGRGGGGYKYKSPD